MQSVRSSLVSGAHAAVAAAFAAVLVVAAAVPAWGDAARSTESPGRQADQPAAQPKIKLEKLDDLPRYTYPIEGKASELLASRERMLALAAQVKKDLLEILARYDIQDRNTLQGMYASLQNIAALEGNEAEYRDDQEKIQSLEDKEASRLTSGLAGIAFYDARRETNEPPESPAFLAAYRKHFSEAAKALPWEIVQDNLKQMKASAEMLTSPLLVGSVSATVDPAVAKTGSLSGELAGQLIGARAAMEMFLPVKDEIAAVLTEVVEANQVQKPNIWPERDLTLAPTDAISSVRVGIWDTGIDASVYPGRLWTNPKETENGRDDDGNGFVDDIHGIAFDRNHDHSPFLLYPLGDAAARRAELEGSFKGLFDLQAALNTPEASAFRKKMASLKPEEVAGFMEEMTLYTHHAHGTHVTGIAIEGNPAAEVIGARLGTDHRLIPDPPTMEVARKFSREMQETVDTFKAAGVRVVNMSWVMMAKGMEDDLEKNGIGKDQQERAQMAREMFAVVREGMQRAFESAPAILFVGGAGNSDNDVDFDEFIPPALDLPNLLIAGAVDQAGEATGFTSFGHGVDVYSNGFEVDSYVPGGHRMKLSGTSMASPNVVNLAAKLLALDPSLTPVQVIDLIKRGADPMGKDGKLLVINPRRSAELLREMQQTRG